MAAPGCGEWTMQNNNSNNSGDIADTPTHSRYLRLNGIVLAVIIINGNYFTAKLQTNWSVNVCSSIHQIAIFGIINSIHNARPSCDSPKALSLFSTFWSVYVWVGVRTCTENQLSKLSLGSTWVTFIKSLLQAILFLNF